MKLNAYTPPSLKATSGISVGQIHCDFRSMAGYLNTLSMSDRYRKVNEINSEIIDTFKEKSKFEKQGASTKLVVAYDKKIKDLKEERKRSNMFQNQMLEQITGGNSEE